MKKSIYLVLITVFLGSLLSVFGQKGTVLEKQIKFAKGKSSATVKGMVRDRLDSHIFHLKANAGQTMKVVMTSSRSLKDAYLCVNFPLTDSGQNETLCEKRSYLITLPRNGDYEIYIEAIRDKIPYSITVTIK